MSRLPSFEDMLTTWNGDILALTLTTGEKVSGQVTVSHDVATVWVTGEWKWVDAGREHRLVDNGRERGYRIDHVIGIEHIKEAD